MGLRQAPRAATWGDAPVLLGSHFPVLSRAQVVRAAGLPYAGDLVNRERVAAPLLARAAPTVVVCGHLHVREGVADGALLQVACGALIEPPFEATLLDLREDGAGLAVNRTAHELGRAEERRDPRLAPAEEAWRFAGGRWLRGVVGREDPDPRPYFRPVRPFSVMGVVNVTPDSFSDGGLFLDSEAAVAHGRAARRRGSGDPRRRRRVHPPGRRARARTRRARARGAGGRAPGSRAGTPSASTPPSSASRERPSTPAPTIVNDVSAFRFDPGMAALVAERGAGCCLMHMLGEPRTMQRDPSYGDVVSEVKAFLEERLAFATSEGVAEERVWLDPGIGFGKTVEHNLELLRRLGELVAIGRPLVVGTSRKSFLGALAGGRSAGERLPGTIATNVLAFERGARVFRVHDVAPVVDALRVAAATVAP